jgi:GntR family transcriptional regulator
MTARHALAGLEREGLVKRMRGAGTFVDPPRIHINKLMSYTEQMSGRSLPVASKILCLSIVSNLTDIAARLALPPTSRLVKLERLRSGGSEPFAIETCYLSAHEFPGLTRKALARGSLFSTVEHEYGVNISYADEEIDAIAADAPTAHLLAIPRGQPLMRIRQVIYSTEGKPIMYVLGLYRSERHTLVIRRFR